MTFSPIVMFSRILSGNPLKAKIIRLYQSFYKDQTQLRKKTMKNVITQL